MPRNSTTERHLSDEAEESEIHGQTFYEFDDLWVATGNVMDITADITYKHWRCFAFTRNVGTADSTGADNDPADGPDPKALTTRQLVTLDWYLRQMIESVEIR